MPYNYLFSNFRRQTENDPRGIAIFTADGHYVVEIFETGRIKYDTGGSTKSTPEVYKDTVLNLSCHFGTYAVDTAKGTITFNINHATYAVWDGTTSVRAFTLEGDKLTWRVPPRADGSVPVSAFTRLR